MAVINIQLGLSTVYLYAVAFLNYKRIKTLSQIFPKQVFFRILYKSREAAGGGGEAQCPVLLVNEPKQTRARSAAKTYQCYILSIIFYIS